MSDKHCLHCPIFYNEFAVRGKGRPDAQIAVVGERPARVEVTTGIPFTGDAGKLLDRVLNEIGIDPTNVFRTNVCCCYGPPDRGKFPPPKPREIEACAKRLTKELSSLTDLKIVVALGSVATKALLDTRKGVTWMRGRIMDFPSLRCAFAAVYHPAFILRNGDGMSDFKFDWERIRDYLSGHKAYKVRQTYYWAKTEEEAHLILEQCFQAKMVSIDFETNSGGTIDFQRDPVLQVNLCWAPGQAGVIRRKLFTPGILRRLRMLSGDPKIMRVLHNGKFDAKFAVRLCGASIITDFDTMLAHHLLDERRGTHALWNVAPRYIGLDTLENLIQPFLPTKKTPFGEIPPRVMAKYGARDADCEYRLGPALLGALRKEGMLHLYKRVVAPAAEACAWAELNGITLDLDYAQHLRAKIRKDLFTLRKAITNGKSINLRSWQQVAHLLYDVHKIPPTDLGRVTNKHALEKMQSHQIVRDLSNYRNLDKLYGTYLKTLILKAEADLDHLVYQDYRIHGTVTGRWSESGAGVMTLPRISWMRKLFRARPGHEFLKVDYKSSEVCWVAVYSKDPALTGILNSGRDLHTETAMLMNNYTREQWETLSEDTRTQLRIYSKAVVFGLLYGRGPQSLSEQLRISMDDAKLYIRKFFDQFFYVRRWVAITQQEAIMAREITTVFGRKRRWGFIGNDEEHKVKRQAINFLPSSSSNDTCMCLFGWIFKELGYAAPVFLHDGLLVEVPTGQAKKIAPIIAKRAAQIPHEWTETDVHFRVDLAVGKNWGEMEKYEDYSDRPRTSK
jgi:uracil-DNA glycosylase family 4